MGRNEYGDVGRRINTFTADLRAQKQALTDEASQVTRLLRSALPDRVVDQFRGSDQHLEDLADSATMIVVTVTGSLDEPGVDHSWTTELASRLSLELETKADNLGIERVRSAGADHVFAAGLGSPDVAAGAAAQFVLDAIEVAKAAVVDSGADISWHAGLASGKVVAGLLSTTQLTYGVFGDPPRVAMALDSIAGPGEVLLDHSTASALGPEWVLEEIDNRIDLRGEPVTAQLLVGRRAGDMEPMESD
jgi:class 3 adenylate cyclase